MDTSVCFSFLGGLGKESLERSGAEVKFNVNYEQHKLNTCVLNAAHRIIRPW
jgi:hypothetical protein